MTPVIILYFLITLIPGFFYAGKKHFLIIGNKKHDKFFMRALYLVPVLSSFSLMLSLFIWAPGSYLFKYVASTDSGSVLFPYSALISCVVLLCPLLADMLIIAGLGRFIRKDVPPEFQDCFYDHSFYLFVPEKIIPGGRSFYTEFLLLPEDRNGMRLKRQKEDLIMDYGRLFPDISFTYDGYIIVSRKAADILEKYSLRGFSLRKTMPFRGKNPLDAMYFQVVCRHILPEMSPKTKVIRKNSPALDIPDNLIYYPVSVYDEMEDFNQTYEIFGDDRRLQDLNNNNRRLWVVSKKTMFVFMKYFCQHKRNFIPVHFIDENNLCKECYRKSDL